MSLCGDLRRGKVSLGKKLLFFSSHLLPLNYILQFAFCLFFSLFYFSSFVYFSSFIYFSPFVYFHFSMLSQHERTMVCHTINCISRTIHGIHDQFWKIFKEPLTDTVWSQASCSDWRKVNVQRERVLIPSNFHWSSVFLN